jgi:hypothetical protein
MRYYFEPLLLIVTTPTRPLLSSGTQGVKICVLIPKFNTHLVPKHITGWDSLHPPGKVGGRCVFAEDDVTA